MSPITIDARGLSCPEPVLLARKALLKAGQGTVIVLVDSVASRENVSRTAKLVGWEVVLEDQSDESFKIILTK